ncbi:putative Serine hydrolase FSH domain-containing protein [Seiridium unicorne]|uniref:Serine hydrolase FSH domain-containing protein n=1 Tax=Seiridium unicorne TaxID=138068 RepID=A0ABR2UFS4_9PEZI
MPASSAPGNINFPPGTPIRIEHVAGSKEESLQYVNDDVPDSNIKALDDLERLVDEEGPFDGVMAFSQGAGLAASLMVHKFRQHPEGEPVFRCAIFFCGSPPKISSTTDGTTTRQLDFESDGELIHVPTAHIWGANDQLYPSFGPVLSKLCSRTQRDDFIHEGGHEIPGAKDPDAILKATRVIKRAIQRTTQS